MHRSAPETKRLADEGRAAAGPFLFRARGDVVDQPDVGQAHGEG